MNSVVIEEMRIENLKVPKMNMKHSLLMNTANAAQRWKFTTVRTYIKNKKKKPRVLERWLNN